MSAPALKTLEFFVNYACNAKCPFCFNPPDAGPELERGLAFGEVARRMYTGFKRGYRAVKFIGGEVTVREDLPKMLALARRIGYRSVQITTNGIRLSDEGYARLLVESGADSFRLSVHGHTPELHDRLVGVPGALARVSAAVGRLKALGVSLGINYVLNGINYQALPQTCLHFYRDWGLDDVIVYFLRYQGFAALPQNRELMRLRMSSAAPHVRRAFELLRAGGFRRLPALIHFPPCVLPELESAMLDWAKDPEACGEGNSRADSMTLPDGSGGAIHELTNNGKSPVAACVACARSSACLGVEREYVELFGESEFRAISGALA